MRVFLILQSKDDGSRQTRFVPEEATAMQFLWDLIKFVVRLACIIIGSLTVLAILLGIFMAKDELGMMPILIVFGMFFLFFTTIGRWILAAILIIGFVGVGIQNFGMRAVVVFAGIGLFLLILHLKSR